MSQEDVEMQAYHRLLSRLLAVSENPVEDHAILSGEGWKPTFGLEERNRFVASLSEEQRRILLALTKEYYAQGVATALNLLEDYQVINHEGVRVPYRGEEGLTLGNEFIDIYAYGAPYSL